MTASAVVVGSGPNGLAAAVTLARAGLDVEVLERSDAPGGAARTVSGSPPGFRYDVGAAVHPMGLASPFFTAFELRRRVDFVVPEIAYAHPLLGRDPGIAYRSLDATAERLGVDGPAWRSLFEPLSTRIDELWEVVGGSVVRVPAHPVLAARFGLRVLEQGTALWNLRFRDTVAPAMLAGLVAHASGRMPHPARAGAGLLLGAHAHAEGWPFPVGGSQAIADALIDDLVAHGGRVSTGVDVRDVGELGDRLVVLDVSSRDAARLSGDRFPSRYRRRLARTRYGAGIFKVDLATSGPVPWRHAELGVAATVHLGGTRAQIAAEETSPGTGPDPFVLVAQPTAFDPSRAPVGGHVVWAYTHVAHGSPADRTEAIIEAIERHAPGFRDTVVAAHATTAVGFERANPNLVGGDLSGGVVDIRQVLARPRLSPTPWRTPDPRIYLCSAGSSPGPGVHGLGGWRAALTLLTDHFPDVAFPDLGVRDPTP
jgi:phytoene dehydrogenase-like protein